MRRLVVFSLLLLILLVAGCGNKKEDKVLARFDGATITESEFTGKVQNLPADIRRVAIHRKKDFLEDLTAEHFLMKEAGRRRIEDQKDVKQLIAAAKKKIIIARLIDMEVNDKIRLEPEEARNYYETHKPEFVTPLLLRASHILVKSEEEAGEIASKLKSGADFEDLAKTRSLDPTSSRGGDLGFFQKGQMVPEFEEAAFSMKKGELRGPVKTQFGFHVIRLTERVEPAQREFRAVRRVVEERLLNEKRSKAFKAYIDKLKGKTKIEINEEALETVSIS
ncbi:MAG: peptidylprolyl isomerase [Candidatus Omnitrophica bacterium]|nr:peptidylprolyl isomerase [Candidatus Omnitrophota bacterium]